MIMMNMIHANTQANCWYSKNKFCLSNWLNKEKKFVKNENFVGFGVGRRDCIGKNFAINILYRLTLQFIINFKIFGPNYDMNMSKIHCSENLNFVDTSIKFEYQNDFTRRIKNVPPIQLVKRI